jgi:hypothetical protein
MTSYPFRPKTTAYIRPGDFWALPLEGGKFGCGRVIELKPGSRKQLIVGLMNWIGDCQPTAEAISGKRTVAQGEIHLKCIHETSGEILGHRSLSDDSLEPDLFLSESPGRNCMLRRGYRVLRHATSEEQQSLRVFPGWGYLVIQQLAQTLAKSAA